MELDCQVHIGYHSIMVDTHTPVTAKGRATRERILQAAAELIAEKGVARMSLDDVRARTGASRSQLYHYFEDRDDLIRAVVEATTDAVLGRQDELFDHLDSWAGIDRWFEFMIQHQIEQQARGGCPIGSLAGQLAENDPNDADESPRQAAQGRGPRRARHGHDGQRSARIRPFPASRSVTRTSGVSTSSTRMAHDAETSVRQRDPIEAPLVGFDGTAVATVF